MSVLCIYHANCVDGLGAAWAVRLALGDDVEFHAANYGDNPFETLYIGDKNSVLPSDRYNYAFKDRSVVIVDFSYPLATLQAMSAQAISVLVLDHHKTAQDDLKDISDQGGTWIDHAGKISQGRGNLAAVFDMNRSGAGITWDYFHPGTPRPWLIRLIEDRDLWKFHHGPTTNNFHAALTSFDITDLPNMLDFLNKLNHAQQTDGANHLLWERFLHEGEAIRRAHAQVVASVVVLTRRTIRIGGYIVPCANVPRGMESDAGHLLYSKHDICEHYNGYPFAATYYDGADRRRHFSLRSPSAGADVGAIAKKMAEYFNTTNDYNFDDADVGTWTGGGHEHAAGFDAPIGWEGE